MSTVEDFQQATESLADDTERQVQAFHDALLAGALSRPGAVLKVAAAVNRGNAVAVSLADAYVAAAIEELTQVPTPTIGILPVDHSERLVKAAETILIEPPTDATPQDVRLARLARSEPMETAQRTVTEAMIGQPLVEGWVRQFDSDPCELCVWWWRNGRVWPKDHPMPTHKGCNCQPRIVLRKNIKSTSYTRRLRRG